MALCGTNILHLNQQTMVAAVQMYLNAQFVAGAAPKVISIHSMPEETSGRRYGGGDRNPDPTFVITTEAAPDADAGREAKA